MKVTQEMIEEMIVEKILNTGEDPRYILLDKESYKEFSKSFIPKEKVEVNNAEKN